MTCGKYLELQNSSKLFCHLPTQQEFKTLTGEMWAGVPHGQLSQVSLWGVDDPARGAAEVAPAAWLQSATERTAGCCSDKETPSSCSVFSSVSSPSEHGSHSSCSLSVEPCTAIWGTSVNLLTTGPSSSTSSLVWCTQAILCCWYCVWTCRVVLIAGTVVLLFSSGSSKLTSCTASCFLKESRRSDRLSFRITTSCSDRSGPESLILWQLMYPPTLLWSEPPASESPSRSPSP